jgi:hypothetical protein
MVRLNWEDKGVHIGIKVLSVEKKADDSIFQCEAIWIFMNQT